MIKLALCECVSLSSTQIIMYYVIDNSIKENIYKYMQQHYMHYIRVQNIANPFVRGMPYFLRTSQMSARGYPATNLTQVHFPWELEIRLTEVTKRAARCSVLPRFSKGQGAI